MKRTICSMAITLALNPIQSVFAENLVADDADIEVIMVKGEKLTRSLQETTSSTTVFTEQTIEETGSKTIYDVFNMASNVNSINGDYGFTIRGIDNCGISGTSDVASVYLDSAVMSSTSIRRTGFSLFDLEAVEILKGPQSTTQGRNALAGAVHLRTTDPDYDLEGKSQFIVHDAGAYNLAAAQNLTIVDDKVAARVMVDKFYTDGHVENITRNQDDWDKDDALTARVKLKFDISVQLKAKLNVINVEKEFGSEMQYRRAELGKLDLSKRQTMQNDEIITEQSEKIAVFNLDYTLDEYWSLESATNFSKIEYELRRDTDATELTSFPINIYQFQEYAFSQEFKAFYQNDWLNSVFAVYHSNIRRDTNNDRTSLIQVPFGEAVVPLILHYNLLDNVENKNIALYTSNDITIGDNWIVNLGLRYDKETVSTLSVNNPIRLNNLGPYNDTVDTLIADSTSPGEGEESYNVFLPRMSVTYKITNDVNVSAVYSTGYRSGGLSVNIARGEAVPYDAEYNDTYELAFRSTWLDNQLTVNANAFYYDWQDQQVNINRSPRP